MKWCQKVEEHYKEVWGSDPQVCEFSSGTIYQLPKDFVILKFPPRDSRPLWTYATCCMSQPDDPMPIELHMFSASCSEEVIEVLVATAHFHRTTSRLGVGHSVNFGKPWISPSNCQHGLVSLPYLDGPRLEILSGCSERIYFYWLIPITKAEVDFKIKHGLDALESKFDDLGLDYANQQRQSVV